ncbi:hypothetical protein [Bacillus siamensis]|uniref:hypothetical protein n=1 Tax=Bacillus siamensis TaxID=659243 RepID=UPI002E1E1E6A|nr:hypothetical protein [Bacillus siamensis]MED0777964.1 hypothetical protein [Bacillus siamensis]MED0832806.1 hypothetical protein [Bacillus siamensis]
MTENSGNLDIFKQYVKGFCKINDISPRKPRFETIENIVVISIKNHLKDGVDLDCFKILNLIYQIVGKAGIKFNQQLLLYPDSDRVARVTVSFNIEDYDALNIKMKDGNIDD